MTKMMDAVLLSIKNLVDAFNKTNMLVPVTGWNAPDNLMNGAVFSSQESCFGALGHWLKPATNSGIYCDATFDSLLCWPYTSAGKLARQHCPDKYGLDTSKFSVRKCGLDGKWVNPPGVNNARGWTNFTACYTPEAMMIMKSYRFNRTAEEIEILDGVLLGTRILEIIGLLCSLISLLISLFIFTYFRSLKCHRTRIHSNLFVSITLEVLFRLVYYTDQQVNMAAEMSKVGFFQTAWACQALMAFMEYFKTAKFMWMLIEGLFLHNMISVSVFSTSPNYLLYHSIGWGAPVPFTISLTAVMIHIYGRKCWHANYYTRAIWIVEGPRITVLVINSLFYCNIIRILISKLRNSYTNEEQQVRKAIKAALVLLPLLGITNFFVMLEPSREIYKFAVWSFTSHFLLSFQGFAVAVVYCFCNGEVKRTVCRKLATCMSAPKSKHSRSRKSKKGRQLQFSPNVNIRRASNSLQSFCTSLPEIAQFHIDSSNPVGDGAIPLRERGGEEYVPMTAVLQKDESTNIINTNKHL